MYSQNALIDGGAPAMEIGSPDNQEVIISHTEYLQDVYGPADAKFTNNELDLNPGLLENFPFLAQLAANYEEYEFIQLIFHFKSTVDASISSTGTTGTLIMATNYNADAAPFLSKESMMQYHGANNCRLDKDMDHGVECDPTKNAGTAIKFVRLMPLVDSQQKKEFDLGKFQWAIVNIPSQFNNQQVGELWVTYTVKLAKPKLAVALGRTIQEDRFITNGGDSTTSILGTNLLKLTQSNIGLSLLEEHLGTDQVKLILLFPNFLTGRYEFQLNSGASAMSIHQVNFFGNTSKVNDIWNQNQYEYFIQAGGNSSADPFSFIFHVDVRPATSGVDNKCELIFHGVDAIGTSFILRPYNPDISLTWEDVNGNKVIPT